MVSTHSDSSQETETETLRSPSSEHKESWDSPTPPAQDEPTGIDSDKEEEPVIGEKSPQVDPSLVTWTGPDDPANPHNWSVGRKVAVSGIWVYGNVVTTVASSIFSSGSGLIEEDFHVSSTVAILGVSLFLLVRISSIANIFYPTALLLSIIGKVIVNMPYRDTQSAHRYGDPCPKDSGASGRCLWGYPCSRSSASL